MEDYKKEFIEFMIDSEVLKFGDFVTKSGRNTPFFVNTGFYRTGADWGSTMQRQSMTLLAWTLTFCLGRLTKAFP